MGPDFHALVMKPDSHCAPIGAGVSMVRLRRIGGRMQRAQRLRIN